MATLFDYKCKSCGYTKAANPQGHDMIMSGELYSYLCDECKEIVDVLYPYGEKPKKIFCPECGSENLKNGIPKQGSALNAKGRWRKRRSY